MSFLARYRWRALLAALLCAAPLLAAAQVLVLGAAQPVVAAWSVVTVLDDPDGSLDAAAAWARRDTFGAHHGASANLGVRGGAVWLRVPLTVQQPGRWLLDIGYAQLDRIDVHLYADGRPVQHAVLGDHRPYAQRDFPGRTHVLPLELAAGSAQELLLRIETKGAMLVPLTLARPEAFEAAERRFQLIQGGAAGITLCLALYALVQGAGSRDPLFLLYGLWVAAAATFFFALHGLGSQHLWPEHAWLADFAAGQSILLVIGFAFWVMERMLDVRAMFPRLAWLMRGLGVLALGTAAAFAAGWVPLRFTVLAGTVLGTLPFLLAVPVAVLRWRQGDAAAPYLFVGWVVYIAGVVAFSALMRGLIDHDAVNLHAYQAATIFEALVWLRVLALRNEQAREQARRGERERQLLQQLASTDALTELPNRRGLETVLEAALPGARPGRLLGFFLLDLDGFKAVNDRLGHAAGDELLKAVARRLRGALHQRDTLARLGGDEFVVVAHELADERAAWALGTKLVRELEQPFTIGAEGCRIGLTTGFALAPLDGTDAVTLLRRADAAMYAGKESGKGTVRRHPAQALEPV